MKGPYILTRKGVRFYFQNPDPNNVNIYDIAWALSNLCRYTGHSKVFYSVAQHSVHASELARDWGYPQDIHRAAFMHDAPEAYVGDVSSPLKSLCPEYQKIEEGVWFAVASRFALPRELPEVVHEIDRALLLWESTHLLQTPIGEGSPARNFPLPLWSRQQAYEAFLEEAERVGVF